MFIYKSILSFAYPSSGTVPGLWDHTGSRSGQKVPSGTRKRKKLSLFKLYYIEKTLKVNMLQKFFLIFYKNCIVFILTPATLPPMLPNHLSV